MNSMAIYRAGRHGRRRGFTALEITAVATIIAILALILIPIMRTRVDEAKVVAAKDDLFSLEKAQSLAFADTGHYYRLQDLNRPAADKAIIANPSDANYLREINRVPQAFWNRAARSNEINALATTTWKGPQVAMHRTAPLSTIAASSSYLISDGTANPGGPILILGYGSGGTHDPINGIWDDSDNIVKAELGDLTNPTADPLASVQYPVDPWGNPYLFFGPGRVAVSADIVGLHPDFTTLELTNYSTARVVSLGPDGLPGSDVTADPTLSKNYFPDARLLGQTGSDDIVREF